MRQPRYIAPTLGGWLGWRRVAAAAVFMVVEVRRNLTGVVKPGTSTTGAELNVN